MLDVVANFPSFAEMVAAKQAKMIARLWVVAVQYLPLIDVGTVLVQAILAHAQQKKLARMVIVVKMVFAEQIAQISMDALFQLHSNALMEYVLWIAADA
jgi:hypothetical protein